MSMPRLGSSSSTTVRIGRQHLADDDFLLIAAGQRTDHRPAAGGLDVNVTDRAVDQLRLLPCAK